MVPDGSDIAVDIRRRPFASGIDQLALIGVIKVSRNAFL
jgi:hypothetical protein